MEFEINQCANNIGSLSYWNLKAILESIGHPYMQVPGRSIRLFAAKLVEEGKCHLDPDFQLEETL